MLRRLISFSVTKYTLIIGELLLSSLLVYSGNSNDDVNRLFFIARSKNANIVCYDVNVDKNGRINEKEPIKVYWINKTDHPGEKSDLNYIQNKLAYGYSSKLLGRGIFEISLVAFPSRKLLLERDSKGRYQGRITINGKQAVLTKIFVQAKSESLLKVAWVDLFGENIVEGHMVTERIIPE